MIDFLQSFSASIAPVGISMGLSYALLLAIANKRKHDRAHNDIH